MNKVILMCGVSGAGKTTFSKEKEKDGYIRLSIDELIWEDYGVYGVDYKSEEYEKVQPGNDTGLQYTAVNLQH